LRHNSSRPRHFCAPGRSARLWPNTPVATSLGASMTSLSPHVHQPAISREILANWLALLTLLALGVVW